MAGLVSRKAAVTRRPVVAAALAAAAMLTLTGCLGDVTGLGGNSVGGNGASSSSGDRTTIGGTLTVLSAAEQIAHLDPQRNDTGVDVSFAGTFLQRSLTTYATGEGAAGTKIVADLATDTGTPDATGKVWTFTLRDGITFEDGSAITCADVKYGVSRSFAQGVITGGPQFAVSMLDIPKDKDGKSIYGGPYKSTPAGVAAFNKAVTCEGATITFTLNRSVPDFNGTTTRLAFGPVPKAKDTRGKYDLAPISSGPYTIESYVPKQTLTLVRNAAWKKESDPIRNAFPDKVVVTFGVDPKTIDQRLIQSVGDDAFGVTPESVDPANLATVFGAPQNAARATDQLNPFVSYYAINTKKVPNLKHRQALMAALDRAALRKLNGGTFAGDFADGVIKPNIGVDYAPTGLWDGLLGEAVPPTGNVELAKKLIAESGVPVPPIVLDYGKTKGDRSADRIAAAAKASWEKAGFTVKLNPIEQSAYFATVLDPAKQGSVVGTGWGPEWLNASTIIPELFTPTGTSALSRWDAPAFLAAVDDARTTLDPTAQAKKWQDLNKQAVQQGLIIPTGFGKDQQLFGTKVKTASFGGKPYINPAFGGPSWNDLYLEK